MTTRRLIITTVAIAACVMAILVIALSGSSGQTSGLSRKKIAELAEFGVTPQQYIRARKRGEDHEAALRNAPPADPNVVGPRVIREEHESELFAWKKNYENQSRGKVLEEWHVNQLSETKTVVSLNLISEDKKSVFGPAEWIINFALNRPLTPVEERIVNSASGVRPLNYAARQLEGFPKPLTGLNLPVELLAYETLSPGLHEIIVSITQASGYRPPYIVQTGEVNEALLRGKELARASRSGLVTLKLSKSVRFYIQTGTKKGLGPRRPSSVYKLSEMFNRGPVPLILGWRKGAKHLHELLRRPVEVVIIE